MLKQKDIEFEINSLNIKESNEIVKENEEKEDKSSNNDIDDEVIYDEDGQPDVNSIINKLKTDKKT